MTSSLFNPTEGYNNGNLFTGLYSQYKNYRPATLSANNEKDQMMLELSRIAFAAHELNLYLDLHPTDQTMLALFNDYKNEADKLTKECKSLSRSRFVMGIGTGMIITGLYNFVVDAYIASKEKKEKELDDSNE